MTSQNRKRFVEKLDFLTSPGYLTGAGARQEAGLPANTGPYKIITDLAVLRFNDDTKRMEVESLHPGITFEQVQENTGFELGKAKTVSGRAIHQVGGQRTKFPVAAYRRCLRTSTEPIPDTENSGGYRPVPSQARYPLSHRIKDRRHVSPNGHGDAAAGQEAAHRRRHGIRRQGHRSVLRNLRRG